MQPHQLINQSSGITEYYTPREITAAASKVMGGIDLDVASSIRANELVGASVFFSKPVATIVDHWSTIISEKMTTLPLVLLSDRGALDHEWFGRVFMNHPFGQPIKACHPGCTKISCKKRGWHTAADIPGNEDWIDKVVDEYRTGRVTEAIVLTFASTSEAWFKPLKKYPQCYFDGRTNYLDPETLEPVKGVTKGSVATYLGKHAVKFAREFSPMGEVKASIKFETSDWIDSFTRYAGRINEPYDEDQWHTRLGFYVSGWQEAYDHG